LPEVRSYEECGECFPFQITGFLIQYDIIFKKEILRN